MWADSALQNCQWQHKYFNIGILSLKKKTEKSTIIHFEKEMIK